MGANSVTRVFKAIVKPSKKENVTFFIQTKRSSEAFECGRPKKKIQSIDRLVTKG